MDARRKNRLRRAAHMLSGAIILLHGYERLDHGHTTGWVFVAAGLLFLSVAFFHGRLAKRWPKVDLVFFVIEAGLSFLVVWELLHAGKRWLPYMYVLAGIMQLVAAVKVARRAPRAH
ncbi:MAG: hypothetical protein IPJ76_09630 [Flavobacteriales bacterium]|nr:MAG: hypothetical protein IPJ76_09630 [Flavobacteriales bacterium]